MHGTEVGKKSEASSIHDEKGKTKQNILHGP